MPLQPVDTEHVGTSKPRLDRLGPALGNGEASRHFLQIRLPSTVLGTSYAGVSTPLNSAMDAIHRIHEFAIGTGEIPPASISRVIAKTTHLLDRARQEGTRVRRKRIAASPSAGADPSEQDMARIVRPYGFVVRIDAHTLPGRAPSLKLLRLADRSRPVAVFDDFAELLEWLAARP